MTAEEIVTKASKGNKAVANDTLYDAVQRLEIMIEKYASIEHRKFEKKNTLLACGGGIAIGYDEMYDAYVKREASKNTEDWDCYGTYDAIFNIEWEKLKAEIVRTTPKPKTSFAPDWRWR